MSYNLFTLTDYKFCFITVFYYYYDYYYTIIILYYWSMFLVYFLKYRFKYLKITWLEGQIKLIKSFYGLAH